MLEAFTPDKHDLRELASKLRKYDRIEARIFSPKRRPIDAIEHPVENSDGYLAVRERESGQIVCIFGVACEDICRTHAIPWFLGTDLVEKYPIQMVRWGKLFIKAMLDTYETLENVVHADNIVAIRWLRGLGFYVNTTKPIWIKEEPFYKFIMPGFDRPRGVEALEEKENC